MCLSLSTESKGLKGLEKGVRDWFLFRLYEVSGCVSVFLFRFSGVENENGRVGFDFVQKVAGVRKNIRRVRGSKMGVAGGQEPRVNRGSYRDSMAV